MNASLFNILQESKAGEPGSSLSGGEFAQLIEQRFQNPRRHEAGAACLP